MSFIIVFLCFIALIIFLYYKTNPDNIFRKIVFGVIFFVFFLIIYYWVIVLGGSYILYLLFDSGEGDSGLWAYGMILGVILSPILSIITTVRKINKK